MPTLLQINTVINSGSTGHIAEELGKLVMEKGWKSYIAYGRNPRPTNSIPIKIGTKLGVYSHVLLTRIFDRHGFGSYFATKKLIKNIKKIKPDIIHLHNIHGYYLNIEVLFTYLRTLDIPIIWTLHDCWSFTGHCSHYTAVNCNKWKSSCFLCPQKKQYPKSLFDNSKKNYKDKKGLFTGLKNLTLVTPSIWLAEEVKKSFLKEYPVKVIHNGIDLNVFKPIEDKQNLISGTNKRKIILGVASVWNDRKGLRDFIELSKMLSDDEEIVLIGVTEKIIETLPSNIKGIKRTESKEELAEWYSKALVYFNASIEETFGMTCAEAQACGTPVIAYNSTALPETISEKTGILVEPNNIEKVYDAIQEIKQKGKAYYSTECRKRTEHLFEEKNNFSEYIDLYKTLINS